MAKIGEEVCVDVLPGKKRRKPPLLGEKLDGHLQEIILGMRSSNWNECDHWNWNRNTDEA